MLVSNPISSGAYGGPDRWRLCHLRTVVSKVSLGVDVRQQGVGREREWRNVWEGGFYAPGLGWQLVTKAPEVMVERRPSLDGRRVCGVSVLVCTEWRRGL